jgi:nicotinate-nucleotide--dimethylbenzimidazole phosphoribosyltransferase
MSSLNRPFQPKNITGMPLDDVRAILSGLPAFDQHAFEAAQKHQQSLFNHPWQLGALALWPPLLAGVQKKDVPQAQRIELCVFAGSHGWMPQAVLSQATEQVKTQILLLSAGGSAANSAAKNMQAGLKLFDLAIDQPTQDPRYGAAMNERTCVQSIAFGMEAVMGQADILCLSSFGAGAFESAAALACLLWGETPGFWLAGQDMVLALPFVHAHPLLEEIIAQAPASRDGLELLRFAGGREMAALLGAIIAARAQNIPVVLEGFAALVCAGILHSYAPTLIDHCFIAAHDGSSGCGAAIARLNAGPVLDLKINSQDGFAALLAAQMLKASVALHQECANKVQAYHLLHDAPAG